MTTEIKKLEKEIEKIKNWLRVHVISREHGKDWRELMGRELK